MILRGYLARIVVFLLVTGLAPACGGKILGGTVGPGEDSGTIGATDGGDPGCVDIVVLPPADLSCESDSDCEFVRTGEVCNGQCWCSGSTPVNAAALARIQSETASLTLVACPCTYGGKDPTADGQQLRCLGGQCTLCGSGPNQPSCNEDGGITTSSDSGIVIVDGSACVDIGLSTYDQSCNQPSDCILIQTGEVCSGQCSCGGTPVSASEQSRYEQATSGIKFSSCNCPAEFPIECRQIGQGVGNTCVVLPP